MQIKNLELRNYRNHKKIYLEFETPLILVVGPNGIGKTNILEAIYVLATGKSQRTKYDKDLIAIEQPFCSITASILSQENETNLDLKILKSDIYENATIKKACVNKVVRSMTVFTGILNAVLFLPEDIQLLTGSPSERRKYLDLTLIQTFPTYKKSLSAYQKALKQRNKILELIREEGKGQDQLDFWTQSILKEGQEIQRQRDILFESYSCKLTDYGKLLNHEDTEMGITYLKNEISETRLEKYQEKEIWAKTTLVGPHRDDFSLEFNRQDVAQFCSRGQQRSTVLALKLSEMDFIEENKHERPLLLLDDIFSELDQKHRKAIMNITPKQQTFISHTRSLEELLKGPSQIITLPL